MEDVAEEKKWRESMGRRAERYMRGFGIEDENENENENGSMDMDMGRSPPSPFFTLLDPFCGPLD